MQCPPAPARTRTARTFENHLTQSFNIIDTSLVQAASDKLGGTGLSRLLRHAPYLRSISTLDATGRIHLTSDPRNKGVPLTADQFLPPAPEPVEILRVGPLLGGHDFHDGHAPGSSVPLSSFIPVIRDVRLSGESWMSAAASVNADYFLNFYSAHLDPRQGTVELLRYDGLLLLGTDEQAQPGRHDADQEVLKRLAASEIGSFEEQLPDGRTTLTAYRASRAYPLVLVVRLDKEKALEDWRQEATRSAGIVGVVLLAALALSGLYFARFERLAREREADQARLRIAAIAFESQEGMVVTDDAYRVLQINKAFTTITGFTAAEVIGGSMNFMKSGLHDSAFYANIRERLYQHGTWAGEILNRHKDGSIHPHFLTITTVRDDEGHPTHYVGTLTDITERRRLEAERDELNRDFVSFLENTTDFIYFKDTDSRFRFCSQALARITGHRSWRDLIGKHTLDVFPPDTGPIYHGEEIAIIRDGTPLIDKTDPYYDGAGRRGWINSCKWPILDEAGKVTGLFGISRDITAHMRTEIDLRIAAIAFESQEGMLITDASNTILRVNRAFTEITGYSEAEAVGRTPRLLRSGRHDRDFYDSMYASLRSTGAWQGEIWNRRKNGEIYPEWMTISTVLDGEGNPSHYVASLTDITERKEAESEIRNLAFYDPLTQLPNRRLLLDRLRHTLATVARSKRHGALLFIDLDNFKTLNDTFGHDMGDLLLQQVADRLVSCVREGDTVARLGGDEFVVLLDDLHPVAAEAATQARIVGDKILATLNIPYDLAGHDYHCTPSIGITLFADHEGASDELMKRADLALYSAKAAGRNTMRFFDPEMQAAVSARAALEKELRTALQQQELRLYYQPQVNEHGAIIGAEALVRWQHPRLGLVTPARFIPLAEETQLIHPLGLWVLETACQELRKWSALPTRAHLVIAVNVSVRQFRQPYFVEQVCTVLDRSGADPHKLKLELTESLLLDDLADVIAKMTALRARGVSFALDDFGTGYSSLAYLQRLPLDQLKIDQSFVCDLDVHPNDAVIARSIVALARNLGLSVIAEGVETHMQRDLLAGLGCPAYQGYLFSPPLTREAFESFAEAWEAEREERP
ncbi:MAG: EAL domain-containing protein [Zoogloea sp.]|uniref:bifunctional diguanylate cyclase/phosphodiesterase n=1 Tax=Zoogloea sp. TaxID=49181 RepID=UPI00262D0DB5|nr:EAL domain-containing protein [Zoogloea sp.]MDD2991052.1 EAL domain-containing protein [Zoogloea sp.]